MKKYSFLVTIVASLLLMAVTSSAADCSKYTIDGDLSDWGLDLTGDWSQNGTWLPSSGVSFVAEDNRDPTWGVLPYGVHIRGTGSSFSSYHEKKIQHNNGNWYIQPYGGEAYDMEAIYFDEDSDCFYVLVVTSESPTAGGDKRPGDLALNLDRDGSTGMYGFEYGVKLGDNYLNQFDIYSMPDWEESQYFPEVKPTIFKSGASKTGTATGVYVDSGISDNGYTNYFIEVAVPKNLVGDPDDVSLNDLYIGNWCGNDYIPAPEFLFAAMPVAIIGIVLAFAHRSAKKKTA